MLLSLLREPHKLMMIQRQDSGGGGSGGSESQDEPGDAKEGRGRCSSPYHISAVFPEDPKDAAVIGPKAAKGSTTVTGKVWKLVCPCLVRATKPSPPDWPEEQLKVDRPPIGQGLACPASQALLRWWACGFPSPASRHLPLGALLSQAFTR